MKQHAEFGWVSSAARHATCRLRRAATAMGGARATTHLRENFRDRLVASSGLLCGAAGSCKPSMASLARTSQAPLHPCSARTARGRVGMAHVAPDVRRLALAADTVSARRRLPLAAAATRQARGQPDRTAPLHGMHLSAPQQAAVEHSPLRQAALQLATAAAAAAVLLTPSAAPAVECEQGCSTAARSACSSACSQW